MELPTEKEKEKKEKRKRTRCFKFRFPPCPFRETRSAGAVTMLYPKGKPAAAGRRLRASTVEYNDLQKVHTSSCFGYASDTRPDVLVVSMFNKPSGSVARGRINEIDPGGRGPEWMWRLSKYGLGHDPRRGEMDDRADGKGCRRTGFASRSAIHQPCPQVAGLVLGVRCAASCNFGSLGYPSEQARKVDNIDCQAQTVANLLPVAEPRTKWALLGTLAVLIHPVRLVQLLAQVFLHLVSSIPDLQATNNRRNNLIHPALA
ncbi:hypothetical protein KCU88_g91, partial [Aureobasidium melanogenum]